MTSALLKAARLAGAAVAIVAAQAALVWPLWLLATRWRAAYTALVGAAALALALRAIVKALRRSRPGSARRRAASS